jgi:hypothetical protein
MGDNGERAIAPIGPGTADKCHSHLKALKTIRAAIDAAGINLEPPAL